MKRNRKVVRDMENRWIGWHYRSSGRTVVLTRRDDGRKVWFQFQRDGVMVMTGDIERWFSGRTRMGKVLDWARRAVERTDVNTIRLLCKRAKVPEGWGWTGRAKRGD